MHLSVLKKDHSNGSTAVAEKRLGVFTSTNARCLLFAMTSTIRLWLFESVPLDSRTCHMKTRVKSDSHFDKLIWIMLIPSLLMVQQSVTKHQWYAFELECQKSTVVLINHFENSTVVMTGYMISPNID